MQILFAGGGGEFGLSFENKPINWLEAVYALKCGNNYVRIHILSMNSGIKISTGIAGQYNSRLVS